MSASAPEPRYPRLAALFVALATVVGLVALRLLWLGSAADAAATGAPEFPLHAQRGSIWDRGGALLATETYVYEVGASPEGVHDPDAFAAAVAPLIGRTAAEVRAEVADPAVRWAPLAQGVDATAARALRDLGSDSLFVTSVARRSYPLGAQAAHVTGFVNFEGVAFYGVEAAYADVLAGRPGSLAGNFGTDPRAYRPPEPGTDLVLTLDRDIQAAAATALAAVLDQESAAGGTVIVLEPATGAILASVSLPAYDPNRYAEADPATFLDPAVSAQYEPGSVVKAMTMAAALDAGVVGVDATYEDTGSIETSGIHIANWDRLAHGTVSMTRLLALSLNVGAVHLGEGLGPERFYAYLTAFGFGSPTGVDLAGEVAGTVHLPSAERDWYAGNLAVNSFGQGMAATPLQVAAALAAIANDGRLMAPHIVGARIGADGVARPVVPRLVRRVVAPATARALRGMLEEVVSGRVTQAALPENSVGGKTGTSEIPVEGGYDPHGTIASFGGFLPVPAPRAVILVKVDRPDVPRGSDVAAPVFRTVARAVIAALDIPPDRDGLDAGATE